MTEELKCKRCGRCCHFVADGRIRRCKHMVKINGKTLCRIYKKRLGTLTYTTKEGKRFMCITREKSPNDYKDCPYNTDRPILDVGY